MNKRISKESARKSSNIANDIIVKVKKVHKKKSKRRASKSKKSKRLKVGGSEALRDSEAMCILRKRHLE